MIFATTAGTAQPRPGGAAVSVGVARHIWTGLDGLRGIAVLAVRVVHASISWSVHGCVGVDAFFCLSGFLITRLLLDEHAVTSREPRVRVLGLAVEVPGRSRPVCSLGSATTQTGG